MTPARKKPGVRKEPKHRVADVEVALPSGATGLPGELTGRYLVLFREDRVEEGVLALEATAGVSVADSRTARKGEGMVFETLGVGVFEAEPEQFRELGVASAAGDTNILAVEPERVLYALQDAGGQFEPFDPSAVQRPADVYAEQQPPGGGREYLVGYRDAVVALVDRIVSGAPATLPQPVTGIAAQRLDETVLTWGLQATNVGRTSQTGQGVKLAVLDTGIADHVDFASRPLQTRSFVPNQAVADRHGHGTHCAGTAGGPAVASQQPRYGVASDASLFIAKVLGNSGGGREGDILEGLDWALQNGCAIVSMSLGAPVALGQPFNAVFEGLAQRALRKGTLIIAAAGNDSRRPGQVKPVSHPANCPSVMAVAAVDQNLRVAYFSNSAVNPNGGGIDIAGPGVAVYSSYPTVQNEPEGGPYRRLNGTSMATPHVAGIAALWAQRTGLRGRDLWRQIVSTARRLADRPVDVGAGLAQAP